MKKLRRRSNCEKLESVCALDRFNMAAYGSGNESQLPSGGSTPSTLNESARRQQRVNSAREQHHHQQQVQHRWRDSRQQQQQDLHSQPQQQAELNQREPQPQQQRDDSQNPWQTDVELCLHPGANQLIKRKKVDLLAYIMIYLL